MGSYGELGKLIMYAIIVAVVLSIVGYAVYSWADDSFEEERVEYRNEIVETHREKAKLEVEKTEHKAVDAFEKAEEKIDAASVKTRQHTKENLEDEKVTEFTDTF